MTKSSWTLSRRFSNFTKLLGFLWYLSLALHKGLTKTSKDHKKGEKQSRRYAHLTDGIPFGILYFASVESQNESIIVFGILVY